VKTDFVHFQQRADRSAYIAKRFDRYLTGSVLDVGCDRAVLRGLLGGRVTYTGIDIGGTPDITVDLETVARLPFDDHVFGTTVCSDVLEHLDSIHRIFDELVRVTRDYLIISLPNNWANARRPVERGRGTIAHYGLPPTRPRDRHKWFFGFSEAEAFVMAQALRHGLRVLELIGNEKPRSPMVRLARHLRFPNADHYRNRYAHTLWVVYAKASSPETAVAVDLHTAPSRVR